jgi:acetylornithine deacetylase
MEQKNGRVLEDAQAGDPVALARVLVATPSVNPEFEEAGAGKRAGAGEAAVVGEAAVAELTAGWLRAWGLSVDVSEVAPGRWNVVGRLAGKGTGPTLLLNGHLDTVGVAGMSVDPFGAELREGRLLGRGSCDMKGGVAALLAATARVALGAPSGTLIVALTADEEHASLGMEALVHAGIRADAAVVCEPTGLAVMLAHKGFVWVEADFRGRAAHGSRPEAGIDAIEHAGLYLTALGALRNRLGSGEPHPLLGLPSFHAGTIDGGSAPSVYPHACRLVLERRTLPGENPADIIEEFQSVLDGLGTYVPELDAKLTQGLARPGTEVPKDSPVVEGLLAACAGEGVDSSVTGMTAWVDAAFLNEAGTPAVCFGPGSIAQAHSADEWIDTSEIVTCAAVLERFSSAFLEGDQGEMVTDVFAEAG